MKAELFACQPFANGSAYKRWSKRDLTYPASSWLRVAAVNLTANKIMVEVPELGFRTIWDDLFLCDITKRMRESGLSRHQAKQAAIGVIDQLKQFGQIRMSRR